MRSIRVSLLVYFLGLLVLAVGSASLLVYSYSVSTLRDKEKATRDLIETRFSQNCEMEDRRLNEALLEYAQELFRRLEFRSNWPRLYLRHLHVLGVSTAQALPSAQFAMMPWLLQGARASVSPFGSAGRQPAPTPVVPAATFEIWRLGLMEMSLRPGPGKVVQPSTGRGMDLVQEGIALPRSDSEVELELPQHTPRADYFQIETNNWCKPIRSRSLGQQVLPSPPEDFGGEDLIHWEVSDYELSPNQWVRRLILKTSTRTPNPPRPITARPTRPSERSTADSSLTARTPSARVSESSRTPRFEPLRFNLYVQVAADYLRLEEAIQKHRLEADFEIASLEEETARSLARLRYQLLFIVSGTFLATAFGSFWLVMLGLAPLRRLSEAVSRISPRDFRLNIDEQLLPQELRPIVERLGATLEQLRRAFAREKQATADISHELRTPLAALRSTLELALRKPRSAEQYREMLQECLSSALHMNQIVERLLTLARLDAGVDRLRVQTFDIEQLAEQCAQSVRPLAEAQGLRLEVNCHCNRDSEGASTQLRSDPDKLREILNNLLHNAVHYNRPDGRIDLDISQIPGGYRLEVRDTGIGISPEAKERIFERFYRADPSRTVDGMNAGLGLAIVKEYVELMGGKISVESEEGRGSTFRLDLPANPPEKAAAIDNSAVSESDLTSSSTPSSSLVQSAHV